MKHALTIVWGLVWGLTATGAAWAHQGHGLPGASHWHASDAWGFVVVAAVAAAAAAMWWRNRQ